ncbi:MAG: hypothetical protein ACFB0C_16445 [Leptolyngbyaceae cyanobacterium]
MTYILLLSIIFILAYHLNKTSKQRDKFKKKLNRYDSLSSQEEYQKSISEDIHLKEIKISALDKEYEALSEKYSGLYSQDELSACLTKDINSKKAKISDLSSEKDKITNEIKSLKEKVNTLQEEDYVQSFGFYP